MFYYKTQYVDNLWVIDDWTTEWLNLGIGVDELQEYVDQLIVERHLDVRLVMKDYNFTQGDLT